MKRSADQPRDTLAHMIRVGCFAILGMTVVVGLVIDLGHLAVVHTELSRAVKVAATAGAQDLHDGQTKAKKTAIAVAAQRFGVGYMNTTSRDFHVRVLSEAESPVVAVHGNAYVPTTFLRYVGLEVVPVDANATAAPEL